MRRVRLALVGFGTVGQGLVRILLERGDALRDRYGLDVRVTAVTDVQRGSVHAPDGLDLRALLEAVETRGGVQEVAGRDRGWDALTTIQGAEADVMAELAYTDLETGEPALTHVRTALTRGLHVITTNKGPVALAYPALAELAARHGVRLEVEGTVMSGTPALHLGRELLAGANVQRIEGILNGTSNFVLGRLEAGLDFATALAEAQSLGYAEADPSGDVDGIDAAGKVVILANLVMGASLRMEDVAREGMRGITPSLVAEASGAGERWKLLGVVARENGAIRASVAPRRLARSHPLAGVTGVNNAVTFTTELLGDVTLQGPGAGRLETGYALVQDLLAIHRHQGGSQA